MSPCFSQEDARSHTFPTKICRRSLALTPTGSRPYRPPTKPHLIADLSGLVPLRPIPESSLFPDLSRRIGVTEGLLGLTIGPKTTANMASIQAAHGPR